MIYVLVVITVFSTSAGVSTNTRFQGFHTRAACETARKGIEGGVTNMKGNVGREVFTACYPSGEVPPVSSQGQSGN